MELKTAQRAKQILQEIELIEGKIKKFNNTKEFCKIEFRGEDGNEREFSFSVSKNQDNDLMQKLRTLVSDELKNRLEKLNSELIKL